MIKIKRIIYFFILIYILPLYAEDLKNHNLIMARRYYKEGLYQSAEDSLNKIIVFSKDYNLKSKALLELGYVKYLSGYSKNTWQHYIKKAAQESNELIIEPYYPKVFVSSIKQIRVKIKVKKHPVTKKIYKQKVARNLQSENYKFKKQELNAQEILEKHFLENKREKEILRMELKTKENLIKEQKEKIKQMDKKISLLKRQKQSVKIVKQFIYKPAKESKEIEKLDKQDDVFCLNIFQIIKKDWEEEQKIKK